MQVKNKSRDGGKENSFTLGSLDCMVANSNFAVSTEQQGGALHLLLEVIDLYWPLSSETQVYN